MSVNFEELLKDTIDCLKTEGIRSTYHRSINVLRNIHGKEGPNYKKWMSTPLYSEKELENQRIRVFNSNITFSFITPLYNTNEQFLREMIDSVIAQTYSNWELCLGDGSDDKHNYVQAICQDYADKDNRIKYKKLENNYGIIGNSNICMEMATGDYISLIDHDDILHPSALYETIKAIEENDADFIYTDEMSFLSPNIENVEVIHFKTDFAPDALLGNNYICHFTSFKRSLLGSEPAFLTGYDGSQDHELFLRLTNRASHIVHIPKVLYYWRNHPTSTSHSDETKMDCSVSGIKAVSDSLKARGLDSVVSTSEKFPFIYRVNFTINGPYPLISILISNHNNKDILERCINSILDKTTYPNFEIVIIENNSQDESIMEYYKDLSIKDSRIRMATWEGNSFNWSATSNYGIREIANGEYIILLDNDTEVITPSWIEEMLMFAQRSDVGAVGAKLYYPDNTIQSAGMIIGLGEIAQSAFKGMNKDDLGYMGRLCFVQNYSAVTGSCLMVRKSVWEEVGGFEEKLPLNYNDVDFCLKIRKAGKLIVWTPYAELYHNEFGTRGRYKSAEESIKAKEEIAYFKNKWEKELESGDPYYNPNLTLEGNGFIPYKTQGNSHR